MKQSSTTRAMVVDFGSHTLRSGAADELAPLRVGPSHGVARRTMDGDDANAMRTEWSPLSSEYPTDGATTVPVWSARSDLGAVGADDDLAVLSQLLAPPVASRIADHPVIAVVPPSVLREAPTLEAWASALFNLGAPAVFPVRATACAALAAGLPTALSAAVGHSNTTLDVVVDGFVLTRHTRVFPIGGAAVTSALEEALRAQALAAAATPTATAVSDPVDTSTPSRPAMPAGFPSYSFTMAATSDPSATPCDGFRAFAYAELMHELKRAVCHVVPFARRKGAVASAIESAAPAVYIAPDGSRIMVDGPTCAGAAEALFAGPTSLRTAVTNLKDSQSPDVQAQLPVLFSGAPTSMRGFLPRMQGELAAADSTFSKNPPILARDPATAAWRGAAMISAVQPFQSLWLTRQALEEEGIDAAMARLN